MTSDIFVISFGSLCGVLPGSSDFPKPAGLTKASPCVCFYFLPDVTASAGHPHCSGPLTSLLPPQASSIDSRGMGPPRSPLGSRGEKCLFRYSVWDSLREHQSNVTWLISIQDTRNEFSMGKLVLFKMCAGLDLDQDIWNAFLATFGVWIKD